MATITGTNGNDDGTSNPILTGTTGSDIINGLGGDDTLIGGDGDDYLDGGPGLDTAVFSGNFGTYGLVDNGDGSWTLTDFVGTDGSDTLLNIETIQFTDGSYDTTTKTLTLQGTPGDDGVFGTDGNDVILGEGGDDSIAGGDGNDVIRGGAGDDFLSGDEFNPHIDEGNSAHDILDFSDTTTGVVVNFPDVGINGTAYGLESGNDLFTRFEGAIGGSGNDTFNWSQRTVENTVATSDFSLDGGAGNDQALLSYVNSATVTGGADGTIHVQVGPNPIFPSSGDRSVYLSNIENVVLNGGNVVVSGSFDPSVNISTGDNGQYFDASLVTSSIMLQGGSGYDTFTLPANGLSDHFDGGGGGNYLDYYNETNGARIDLGAGTASGPSIGSDTFANFDNAGGGPGNDVLVGNDYDNELDGWEGNDTLTSGGGNDYLDGGADNDTAIASGNYWNYSIVDNGDGSLDLTDNVGNDGADYLVNIETIQFADGTYDVASQTFTPNAQQGVVEDGYLAGATVFSDENMNGIWDNGEAKAIADATGHYSISGVGSGPLVAVGGTNIDTGLPNGLVFSAPTGSAVINPLTTLVQALVAQGSTVSAAETKVASALGLGSAIDLLTVDPLGTPNDPASLAAQKAAASIVEIVNAAQDLKPGSGAGAFDALALILAGSSNPVSLTNSSVVTSVLQTAAPGADVTGAVTSVVIANTSIGNATSAGGITAIQGDIIGPDKPTNLADASIVNGYVNATHDTQTQSLTGAAEALSIVTVYDGNTKLGTTTTGQDGHWSYQLGVLANGGHSLTVTATDAAGNVSELSNALAFTVDIIGPDKPTNLADASIVSGYVNAAHDTATQVLTGKAEAGSTVTIYDGNSQLNTVTAGQNGNWSYTLGVLANGAHSLAATATDAAGNVGQASSALAFTVDTVAPNPILSDVATNGASTTLSGTSELSSTVKIFDGATLVGTAVANASGKWTLTTSSLSSGVHNLSLQATDLAGNTGSSAGDNMVAGTGNDILTGHATHDLLAGGAGNDTVSGGAGNDRLIGGLGNDILTGGAGADTFVFATGLGKDTVKDFTPGTDHLEFSRSLFTAGWSDLQIYNYLLSNSSAQGSGHDLVIKLDTNDTVTLTNVTLASLHQSDFIFT